MWRFESTLPFDLPDAQQFLNALNAHADFFQSQAPVVVARAPGRLDLMGGIADYSGSLVLELPLSVATYAAVQPVAEPEFVVMSTTVEGIGEQPLVSMPLHELAPPDNPLGYEAAQDMLASEPGRSWVAYVAGALPVLARERGVRFERGLRVFIHSSVPTGKGVSSSAALEVATMQAICGVQGIRLDGRDLALLCQKVENTVVGAPCGVMDQMTAAVGEENRLLALLCQPAEILGHAELPSEIEVWGIDSGIRHAVSGADYGSVRAGAFMGYRIAAEQAGLPVSEYGNWRVEIEDRRWGGYLANIPPSMWESSYRDEVPESIQGAEFLKRYGGTTDTVTHIEPEKIYSVRQPTAHPIYEHQRVRLFRRLLESRQLDEEALSLLGELMYQSHSSYGACGLGSDGTDRLVDMVRRSGPSAGLYGAKITGGGSGGTVAVLGRRGSLGEVEAIAARYEQETGHPTTILGGSSPGAVLFGTARLGN